MEIKHKNKITALKAKYKSVKRELYYTKQDLDAYIKANNTGKHLTNIEIPTIDGAYEDRTNYYNKGARGSESDAARFNDTSSNNEENPRVYKILKTDMGKAKQKNSKPMEVDAKDDEEEGKSAREKHWEIQGLNKSIHRPKNCKYYAGVIYSVVKDGKSEKEITEIVDGLDIEYTETGLIYQNGNQHFYIAVSDKGERHKIIMNQESVNKVEQDRQKSTPLST